MLGGIFMESLEPFSRPMSKDIKWQVFIDLQQQGNAKTHGKNDSGTNDNGINN